MATTKKNAGIKVKGFDAFNFEEFEAVHYGLNACKLCGMERHPNGSEYRPYAHVVLFFFTAEAGENVNVKKTVRLYDTKPVKYVDKASGDTKYFDSPAKQFCDSVARANGGITKGKGINATLKYLAENFTPCMITREIATDKDGNVIKNEAGFDVEYDKLDFNLKTAEESGNVRMNPEEM